MRHISTIVQTGTSPKEKEAPEQIFMGQQPTFHNILHIEFLGRNTLNTHEIDLFTDLRLGGTRLREMLSGAPINPPLHIFGVRVMWMCHTIIHTN